MEVPWKRRIHTNRNVTLEMISLYRAMQNRGKASL